ncbi:ZIP family zinc transporter [Glutamicibacter sp. PS]|uniref:ZIP family metal transporter n=1 Tax=Glutamicibacter sp. PS TaxID=3075634 RepID=UPI0028404BDC|nr:ZIP family zinc transporter [Glutamicibacter sp. PS]MDR4534982.1 ZIP family zinc transporter [Glutamicibacter sp. PS]
MFEALTAFLWGSVAGAALLLGAGLAWFLRIPRSIICAVMAFGSGVLISALSFELVLEAADAGGLLATAGGVAAGSLLYFAANRLVGARPKRKAAASGSGAQNNSGIAIEIGALIDGIPESVALGVGLVAGGGINPTMVAAIFISNVPEGLASTADLKSGGRNARSVFGLWTGTVSASGLAAALGYLLLAAAAPEVLAFATAVAAGGILTMLADTMIPEAYAGEGDVTGLLVVLGFLSAFALHVIGG